MSDDAYFPDPDFIPDPIAPDGQIHGNDLLHTDSGHPAAALRAQMQDLNLREKYIGAVSLLCRVYAAMGRERREDFERDGDPMARLAEDFNRLSFTLSMERASGGWGLFQRKEKV